MSEHLADRGKPSQATPGACRGICHKKESGTPETDGRVVHKRGGGGEQSSRLHGDAVNSAGSARPAAPVQKGEADQALYTLRHRRSCVTCRLIPHPDDTARAGSGSTTTSNLRQTRVEALNQGGATSTTRLLPGSV
ncbi:hypothetical protein GCM10017559_71520 [Streptosporangium longisporum]|uniref:Uncharacterized protein n=1 Tax=Streptosporangium longisporum TaxID=46187 RepID=A0ABP6L8N0_9ACTN